MTVYVDDYLPPPWAVWIAACALALLLVVLAAATIRAAHRAIRRAWKARRPKEPATLADVLTWAAAGIATGVSAQGMWKFAGDVLGLDGPLRLLLFAFIEIGVVTSAVRARKNVKENYSAGIDGVAVWFLASVR